MKSIPYIPSYLPISSLSFPCPDQEFTAYILRGIEHGSQIGLNPTLVTLQSARGIMSSAGEQLEVVSGGLCLECQC